MIVIVSHARLLSISHFTELGPELQQAAVHSPAKGVSNEKEFMILPYSTFKVHLINSSGEILSHQFLVITDTFWSLRNCSLLKLVIQRGLGQ